ncbi:MAG: hypothetical protein R8G01_13145 [Ilumatobacteraceae bacterium]|nr:hypothetical protein [Ilumatobacteraceae bacterium]
MKRTMTVVAALTLVAAACGGGDASSDATTETPAESTEESTEEVSAEIDEDATADESSDGPGDDTDTSGTDDTDEDLVDDDDDRDDTDTSGTDDDGPEIRSISDVPAHCRDAMADFLRAVEPIVEDTDWTTASIADFERIATEFEEQADEFEDAVGDTGCDDMNFVDDSEGEILIEFARDEAPGAVGFLEFLDQMRTGAAPGGEDPSAAPGIETCQDAIDFLQGLMDDYDSLTDVPAAELLKIPGIAPLYATCTPEQLEFFDDVGLEEFMNG